MSKYVAGRRVPDGTPPHELEPGDYGRWNGLWVCCCPGDGIARGNLSKHEVVEHENGVISVTPSILVTSGSDELYHGYLTNGVWTSC